MTRYTQGHDESVLRSHRWRTAENSAAHLLPHLSPDDTSSDVVHAHQVLQHLADPVAAIKEMTRVTRPGLLALRDADHAAMTWHPQPPGMDEWLALYRRVARGNGAEPDAGRITQSALEADLADQQALQRMATVWRDWAATGTAWFAVLNGEVLCRVTTSG